MNRRILIALAVVVPVVVFVPMKIAASWRPVKIATMSSPPTRNTMMGGAEVSLALHASERALVLPTSGETQIIDLQTGAVRTLQKEGIVAGGNGEWRLADGAKAQLIVRQNAGAERAYDLPPTRDAEWRLPMGFYQQVMMVAANSERVEMALGRHYYRWNTDSRALERDTLCVRPIGSSNQAIARDGRTIICAFIGAMSALSTQTGTFVREDKLQRDYGSTNGISDFGGFALYSFPMANATSQYLVVSADAREL